MKRAGITNTVYSATATALLLAALLWSALLLAREPAKQRQRDKQQTLTARLAALEREAATLEAFRQPFTGIVADKDLNSQLTSVFGSDGTARTQIETDSPTDSFTLHSVTVDYESVNYTTLTAHIRRAEALRPPLKLTDCLLEAAPGKSGEGRAQLKFERIEWR